MASSGKVPQDDIDLVTQAIQETCRAIRIAKLLLKHYKSSKDVKRVIDAFCGAGVSDNEEFMERLLAAISKLAKAEFQDIGPFYTPTPSLYAGARVFEASGVLKVRFAAENKVKGGAALGETQAEALPGHDIIIIRPAMFRDKNGDPKFYARLASQVVVRLESPVNNLLINVTAFITHETTHCILNTRDIGVKACHVPAEFKSKHPRAIRVESTGDYVAYELDMCYILAGSPQKHEALNNAQSNTGLIMFLYRLYENRDIDISTGIAKRRSETAEDAPGWMAGN